MGLGRGSGRRWRNRSEDLRIRWCERGWCRKWKWKEVKGEGGWKKWVERMEGWEGAMEEVGGGEKCIFGSGMGIGVEEVGGEGGRGAGGRGL